MDIKLVMFRDDDERREFPMMAGVTSLGRKEDCDIRIPVTEVSRHHAELHVGPKGAKIKDLGSANGTYVNNQRVTVQDLSAGDHIIIGPVVFTVQIDGKPEDIRPVKTALKRKATAKETARAAMDDELDPISALEALASSADQTALQPLDDDDDDVS